jgi:hypothetical protein
MLQIIEYFEKLKQEENGYQEIRLRSGGQRKEAHEFTKELV